ncbi:MAG: histidine phosphotransferase [Rhodobacteraceae bacterium]|nr:histidine phosphotransferase [Paracoccaceae bacterium]
MGLNNANLATLIGSRICHDLISPIGAITNGLELLDLAGSVDGPELDLIADSVGNAGARIRFFRIAYGSAGDQALGRSEIVSVMDDMNRGSRVTMQWGPLEAQPRSFVRLAFLALQCCETAMPYGGLAQVHEADGTWTIVGEAEKLNVDPALWSVLTDGPGDFDITPALVQFALLATVAEEFGLKLSVEHSDNRIAVHF